MTILGGDDVDDCTLQPVASSPGLIPLRIFVSLENDYTEAKYHTCDRKCG